MRRLGAALRVEAMSLYKHVPDKSALLDRIVASVWAEFGPPPAGAPWDARLRHVARELRALALRHPHVFPLLATRVPATADAFGPLEAALAALADAGLGDDAILRHFWAFIAWSTGALLAECAAATGSGAPVLEVPESIDRASHPQLARLRGALAGCEFAAVYERGLELLVTAVRARL
jgi:AcrR family transcriptional regulator